MGVEAKGKTTFDVGWILKDRNGNVKDKGETKGVVLNGDVSE
jgi:hypothetical protein